ncbi:MAG: ABC transporter ATP-binding protein [Bacilli bacterium]|nr:ABC transporter ATP-binding protein [Bacilli bacterium]
MKKTRYVFPKFISFAFSCYKPYFFVVFFQALTKAGLTLFNAFVLSFLIRYLEKGNYKEALMVGVGIVLINLLFNFLDKLNQRLMETTKIKMTESINQRITYKLTKVPYQYLEDPYYLDLKERAKFAVENQNTIVLFLNALAESLQIVLSLIGLITIIVMFDYLLLIILIIAVVFKTLLVALSLRTQFLLYRELLPINRKFGYYLGTINDERRGKDYRMYSVGQLMTNQFKSYGNETIYFFGKLFKKTSIYQLLDTILKYLEMGFVYGFIALKTIVRKLPVSSFSLYISSSLSFSTLFARLIEVFLDLGRAISYLGPFIELVELKEAKEEGEIGLDRIREIEFKNVSFSYPRSNDIILDNLSFSIKSGEKISIVGLNGAGKTTLIKLLCRLYKPNSGEILVNGLSIYEYDYDAYLQQISAVFQDFKLFSYTLRENILNEDGDEDLAYQIASKVGLKSKIDSLPDGINSLYSKIFDEKGIELSGGETQKIAIARALNKDSSLVILDEPTSALDPLAEAEIYQHFNELVQDKTAIYISHRMSSSVFCDRIIIIDMGKIADIDTHVNLMKKTNSLYYKLFMTQAKNYQK